MPKKVFLKKR